MTVLKRVPDVRLVSKSGEETTMILGGEDGKPVAGLSLEVSQLILLSPTKRWSVTIDDSGKPTYTEIV